MGFFRKSSTELITDVKQSSRFLRSAPGRLVTFVGNSEFVMISSAVAFTTTLAIIPLLAVSLSVFKFVGGFELVSKIVTPMIFEYLAVGTSQEFIQKFHWILQKASGRTLSIVGFLVFFLTSVQLMSQIEKGMQIIWGLEQRRPYLQRWLIYLLSLIIFPIVASISLGLVGSFRLRGVPLVDIEYLFIGLGSLFIFSLIKFVPNTRVSWRSAFIGSLICFISYFFLHSIFFWITKNILMYNKIYGSLASIPIFLLWILWSWQVFFFGVTLSAAFENEILQKKKRVLA
jgi:membrane protein